MRSRPSTTASTSSHTTDRAAALRKVRKGDADVAVEMVGNTLVAHYTQTDQVKAAITQGTLQAFVDAVELAQSERAAEVSRSGPCGSRTSR